jgi:hypothetical protein
MDRTATPLERAFELARSGKFATVTSIKKRLKEEGCSVDQITGRSLTRQLDALMKEAAKKGPAT